MPSTRTTWSDLCRLGKRARHARLGSLGQRRLLGSRNNHRRPKRLAQSPLHRQSRHRCQFRIIHRILNRARRLPSPRHRQPQHPQSSPPLWRWPSDRACIPRQSNFKCCTAWPTPSNPPWSPWAGASASTCPSADCCPAWHISSAACSKIPPTNPSCAAASSNTCPRSNCS